MLNILKNPNFLYRILIDRILRYARKGFVSFFFNVHYTVARYCKIAMKFRLNQSKEAQIGLYFPIYVPI